MEVKLEFVLDNETKTNLIFLFNFYQHDTNDTEILCADTVQYVCVIIIAAITLYVSSSAVIYIHGHNAK